MDILGAMNHARERKNSRESRIPGFVLSREGSLRLGRRSAPSKKRSRESEKSSERKRKRERERERERGQRWRKRERERERMDLLALCRGGRVGSESILGSEEECKSRPVTNILMCS